MDTHRANVHLAELCAVMTTVICIGVQPASARLACVGTRSPSCKGGPIFLPPDPRPNLVINGTFDTGDFTGWSLVNDEVEEGGSNTVSPGQGNPRPSAQNDNIELIGGISQPISTVPGRDYHIMFDLFNQFPQTGYNGAFRISFGSQVLMTRPYVPYTGNTWTSSSWKTFEFNSAR